MILVISQDSRYLIIFGLIRAEGMFYETHNFDCILCLFGFPFILWYFHMNDNNYSERFIYFDG